MDNLSDHIQFKLLQERKVFLWGEVNDASAFDIINQLQFLNSLDFKKPIELFINSPGGVVSSGMAIHDAISYIEAPVHTICTGLAASMGSIILSAGSKGNRYITKFSKVMIHQPSGGINGAYSDIEIQIEEIMKTKKIGAQILAENCNQSVEKILVDFDRDYWMDSEEAIEYGIVDEVYSLGFSKD